MDGHAVDVCSGNTRRRGDGGLDTTLAEPLDISIDGVCLPAPRLASEENIESCFQYRERFILRHRESVPLPRRAFWKCSA